MFPWYCFFFSEEGEGRDGECVCVCRLENGGHVGSGDVYRRCTRTVEVERVISNIYQTDITFIVKIRLSYYHHQLPESLLSTSIVHKSFSSCNLYVLSVRFKKNRWKLRYTPMGGI